MRIRLLPAAAAASALLLSACGKDAGDAGQSLLAYVPADTPYVVANLEPFDAELRKAWIKASGGKQLFALYRSMLGNFAAVADDEDERKAMKFLGAVLDEFEPMVDPEQRTPLGMAEEAEVALYGYGLLPVMRLRLADPAAFEQVIARLEQSLGSAMTSDEVGGYKLRRQVIDEVVIYLAVIGDQAVFALIPSAEDQAIREQVLGLQMPEQSMADSGKLEQLATQYGLQRNAGVGLVDTVALVGALLNPTRPGDRALLNLGEKDAPTADLDATCQAEVNEISALVPRLVMGAKHMDAERMDAFSIFEMAPETAQRWAAVSAPQPGAKAPKDGWVWFGFGIDPVKTGTALRGLADLVAADPFQCEHLTDLNDAMAQMKEGLNPMAIGMAANFTGVFVNLDKIVLDDQQNPISGEGVVAISSPAPAALWALAKGQLEMLESLDIGVDKGVVAVPTDLFPMPLPAKALMTERSLALAVGDIDDARVEAIAAVDPQAEQPIFRYGLTGRFYSEFYGDLMERAMLEAALDDDDGEAMAKMNQTQREQFAKDMRELMRIAGETIDYMDTQILFTEGGLEMRQQTRMK